MAIQAPFGVRTDFDVPATMRDGTVLRANVYRPDDGGAGTYPVLLTRTPYGKDLPFGANPINSEQAARQGYIVVVQDVRGSFNSEGEWYPFEHEGSDGVDTVAWAARLPGSNGVVATYGMSYVGFTQWAAARDGAKELRAMVPGITWDAPVHGIITRDGVLELGTQAWWTMQVGMDKLVRRHRGDPQALGRSFYALTREFDALPVTGYTELPLESHGPLARLGLDEQVTEAVRGRLDPSVTAPARITGAYETTDIPVFHIGGWYDIFLDGTIRNFQQMRARGREHQYLLIGPWTHGVFNGVIGDIDFGMSSSGALLDLQTDIVSLQLRFFDHYLKHAANGFELWPTVKYFVMGANVWKASDMWPPAGAVEQVWYIHSRGSANSLAGDGSLDRSVPENESADTFVYDPADPVPTVGGATLMHPVFRAGPRDQRSIEARQDMLVYTSDPLEVPIEVTGPVSVRLYVSTDGPDTDFVARLVDVYPDGRAIPLTDGVTRLRYRHGATTEAEELAEPRRVYGIDIDLWATSNVFLAGHRIRLDVTSSNFPRWERNLNTGSGAGSNTEMRRARQTVLHDREHQSQVRLSVIEG